MAEFKLPDPGEGLVEADIVTWRVAVGDRIEVNDILVEIETAKSIVELPSPFAGTVTALLVSEGDTVEVGTPIITVDDGTGDSHGGAVTTVAAEEHTEAAEAAESERTPNLVGYGAIAGSSKRRPRRQPVSVHAGEAGGAASALVPEPIGSSVPAVNATASSIKVRAKPPVRKLAKDRGIDLTTVTPSGPDGIITRDDVLSAESATAAGAAPVEPTVTRSGLSEQRIPIKGVRKATAQAMVASAFTAPHVTEWLEVDVTASVELLDRLRKRREFAGLRLSPTVLAAKAVCLAAARTPQVNSSWDADAGEIVLHGQVNLGIAAATPRGLVVPNIPAADRLDLAELARALDDLVQTARAGRTQPAQMAGGTITITNVGVFGVDGGTPILNPGESAILATGAITRKPWVVDIGDEERIVPRSVMTLALSFDHRVVDGEQGSRFLADVARLLSDPATAFLY
ncbi:dihydrolipoamide acetyltransferase family protein [Naumannella halotolerans]|uniref:Dihydrolipoamide acetyltransferase component of pyruvate dehydrogenase complex n=1 Tax=Naumannella halotolerans TaxID=993414 RepID=A0A4R7J4G5_9ACTN|nr:dihydrolipoamide acetyltransferase family protein [Naumannella halotolerans]TDT31259.1 pyruvate dehydrogenase E2 component (dihydrolipoamide acetyltransferase) [Naumannella halotolerans]